MVQGTMQASVMVPVFPALTTTDDGCEHGSSRLCPPSTSMMSGDRPETWYRPGGSGTENSPEDPTVTVTAWCPALVKVTVPDMGRSPGCVPPGLIGPPSMTSFPARRPLAGCTCPPAEAHPAASPVSSSPASAQAQIRSDFIAPPFIP
jgi:hypothetical protein